MKLWPKLRPKGRGTGRRADSRADRRATVDALEDWMAARTGVEVFVEPKTAVSGVTMVLVAHDGEFTRRKITDPESAKTFARPYRLPVYDATIVGYPQRMRDYSRRQTILQRRAGRKVADGS